MRELVGAPIPGAPNLGRAAGRPGTLVLRRVGTKTVSEPTGIGSTSSTVVDEQGERIRWRRSNSFDAASEFGTTPIERSTATRTW